MTRNNVSVNKIFSGIGPVKPIDNIDRTKDDLIHRNDYENNNFNHEYTKIYFKGGKILNISASYTTIDSQITKCIKIEKYLSNILVRN